MDDDEDEEQYTTNNDDSGSKKRKRNSNAKDKDSNSSRSKKSSRQPLAPIDYDDDSSNRKSSNSNSSTQRRARRWSKDEDEKLRKAVASIGAQNWKQIAEHLEGRTDVQCLHRWQKVLDPDLIKGPWSKEEDELVVQLVAQYGPKKWSKIASHLKGRIGKQCRERWHNHLNPAIRKDAWTPEEDNILLEEHARLGNKWAEIARKLPGAN